MTFGTASAFPGTPLVERLRIEAVPNPFRPTTTLRFDAPHSGPGTVDLLDPSGRIVRALASRHFEAGPHTLRLDDLDAGGVALGSGVYFARFRFGGVSATTKLVLLK